MQTTKLNTGITVLAHETGKHIGSAKTFANRSQAVETMQQLVADGINATVYAPRAYPFYVAIEN